MSLWLFWSIPKNKVGTGETGKVIIRTIVQEHKFKKTKTKMKKLISQTINEVVVDFIGTT